MDRPKHQRGDNSNGPEANSCREGEQQVSAIEKFFLQADKNKGDCPECCIFGYACRIERSRSKGKTTEDPNERDDQAFGRKPQKYSLPIRFAECMPGRKAIITEGP